MDGVKTKGLANQNAKFRARKRIFPAKTKTICSGHFFTLEFVPNGIEVDPGIAAQTRCYVLLELAQRHAANAVERQGKETGGVPR